MRLLFRKKKHPFKLNCDFKADGLGVKGKSLSFLYEDKFERAWNFAEKAGEIGWAKGVPDIRWRAHVAIWAAKRGMSLEGDFVECGVHTGLLSLSVCKYHDFERANKNFWLFDTWAGIPLAGLSGNELAQAKKHNEEIYKEDIFNSVKYSFSPYNNVCLIRGLLPDTLHKSNIEKVAYLSIDLNNALAEQMCIQALWDKIVFGAVIVIDDYGFLGHEGQKEMWDAFAAEKNQMIMMVPTGRGLIIKS